MDRFGFNKAMLEAKKAGTRLAAIDQDRTIATVFVHPIGPGPSRYVNIWPCLISPRASGDLIAVVRIDDDGEPCITDKLDQAAAIDQSDPRLKGWIEDAERDMRRLLEGLMEGAKAKGGANV